CYRGILKELMREGAQQYLVRYGGDGPVVASKPAPPAPSYTPLVVVPTKPVIPPSTIPFSIPSDAGSVWVQNGTRVFLLTTPNKGRKFVFETAVPAVDDGASDGKLFFEGRREG